MEKSSNYDRGIYIIDFVVGGTPYPTMNNSDLLVQLKRGYRMEKPENCAQLMYLPFFSFSFTPLLSVTSKILNP